MGGGTSLYGGLPANYTSNAMYQYYLNQFMQQQQLQQQAVQQRQAYQDAVQQQAEYDAYLSSLQAQQGGSAQGTEQTQQVAQVQQAQQGSKVLESVKPADGKDDGSIGFWGAVKNFGKGVGNFFKGMVCDENGKFSLKRTLTTVAVTAGAVALTVATGGAATPFLIAAGATIGTVQVGKGVYKVATAKTDREAEAAWQDIGAGTTAVVGAVAGAKGALKSAGSAYVPKGNIVTSALRATGECFRISAKGVAGAARGLMHPMQSARSIGAYWSNTVKPNLQNAFSYKNGHNNYTEAVEATANKKLQDINVKQQALIEELNNPATSAARKTEITAKLSELENQVWVETQKINLSNSKAKVSQAFDEQIANVEAKLADGSITTAERARLTQLREMLYREYHNCDARFAQYANKNIKAQENALATAKEALKTATGDEKVALETSIKNAEQALKALKSHTKIEIAQHNISRGNAQITRLKDQLRLATTDAQKAAIESRIALVEKAMAGSKQTLRNANYKIAAQQHLPQIGLAYGTYRAVGQVQPQTLNDGLAQVYGFESLAQMEAVAAQNGLTAEQLADFIDAQYAVQGTTAFNAALQQAEATNQSIADYQRQIDAINAQQAQQSQQTQYPTYNYTSNYSNMTTPYAMNGDYLSFNDLYVSPYPEYI